MIHEVNSMVCYVDRRRPAGPVARSSSPIGGEKNLIEFYPTVRGIVMRKRIAQPLNKSDWARDSFRPDGEKKVAGSHKSRQVIVYLLALSSAPG